MVIHPRIPVAKTVLKDERENADGFGRSNGVSVNAGSKLKGSASFSPLDSKREIGKWKLVLGGRFESA